MAGANTPPPGTATPPLPTPHAVRMAADGVPPYHSDFAAGTSCGAGGGTHFTPLPHTTSASPFLRMEGHRRAWITAGGTIDSPTCACCTAPRNFMSMAKHFLGWLRLWRDTAARRRAWHRTAARAAHLEEGIHTQARVPINMLATYVCWASCKRAVANSHAPGH